MIVVPSLHPAFLLRSSDDDAKSEARFKHIVERDVARAVAFTTRKPSWDESVIWKRLIPEGPLTLFPTIFDVRAFAEEAVRTQRLVWIDVEATGESPMECTLLCVGMGFERDDGTEAVICVPFLRSGGLPYWSAAAYTEALSYVAMVCERCNTGFQNGAYDTVVLWRHGMPVWHWLEDTMQAHHIIDSELPHGLAFLASICTEIPYYKDSVKGDEAWINKDDLTLRLYNLRDVLCTMRSFKPLIREVRGHKLEDLYREEIRLAQIMSAATVRGLMVDVERRDSTDPEFECGCGKTWLERDKGACPKCAKKGDTTFKPTGKPFGLGPKLIAQRDTAIATLRAIATKIGFVPKNKDDQPVPFNPGSIIQLRAFLFDALKFPIVAKTDKGAPSTDKKAMVLLAASAESDDQRNALSALMRWRRTSKLISTYVEGLPILSDGRLHPSWKNLTVTGRFATSPNAQNWPPSVKRLFRAAPGYRFVSIDLSQAELRVIAYFSQDPDLLIAYEKGLNVHTMNTTLSFHVRNPGEDTNDATEEYLKAACPRFLGVEYESLPIAPKKQWKMMRRLAKNLAFGDNYGAMAETLFDFIRAQRDPETDQPYFPDLTLGDVEAWKDTWETKLHPAIPRWWQRIVNSVNNARKYQDPISGRIRWFRAGLKRNEILNTPVQGLVASYMNKRTLEVSDRLSRESPMSAIVLQVHDMICVEAPEADVAIVSRILEEVFRRPFKLRAPYLNGPTYEDAVLPCDDATNGVYLDEV